LHVPAVSGDLITRDTDTAKGIVLAIMIEVEAEETIKARTEYLTVGIKGIPLNAARAERAVSG
jgi:hypothetical protein